MGFPRQAYWSGLLFPSSGDLPDPGTEPESPALVGGFFTTEPQGEKDLKRKRASWNQRTKANKQTSNNKAYSNLRIYLHSLTKDCSNVSRSLSERNKMYSSPWNNTGLNCAVLLTHQIFSVHTNCNSKWSRVGWICGWGTENTEGQQWVGPPPRQLLKCQPHLILFMLFTCVTSRYSRTSPMKEMLLSNISNKNQRPREFVYWSLIGIEMRWT